MVVAYKIADFDQKAAVEEVGANYSTVVEALNYKTLVAELYYRIAVAALFCKMAVAVEQYCDCRKAKAGNCRSSPCYSAAGNFGWYLELARSGNRRLQIAFPHSHWWNGQSNFSGHGSGPDPGRL